MPFLLRNLTLSPYDREDKLLSLTANLCRLAPHDISDFRILRKGVDARHKAAIKLVHTVSFTTSETALLRARLGEVPGLEWQEAALPAVYHPVHTQEKIVIVGTGPAGLFCALRLAQHGLSATVIERGQPVEQRAIDVQKFWKDRILNTESNVQFGEGGAGTFSDGKLTCRSKDPLVPWILQQLADFGAEPEICYLAKPHIGTDRLRLVVANIRNFLIEKGFAFYFGCKLCDIVSHNNRIVSIVTNDQQEFPCDRLILATGHSARDTYQLLVDRGIPTEQKPFAMGLRIEHPQELINSIQYGSQQPENLPVADYAVTWNNTTSGRSAYSFCMCPGGIVIGGASEAGGVVTNGMSSQKRNSPYANSALVVNVRTSDFNGNDPMAGVRFQRYWEQQAYLAGGSNYSAPAQNLLTFLKRPGARNAISTYRPGITETLLDTVLPDYILETLREGIPDFGRKLRGFVSSEATLVGIESRTSAPIRIPRNEKLESIGMAGLYPAGEGAGYAGGIMSAAVDGVRIADMIVAQLQKD